MGITITGGVKLPQGKFSVGPTPILGWAGWTGSLDGSFFNLINGNNEMMASFLDSTHTVFGTGISGRFFSGKIVEIDSGTGITAGATFETDSETQVPWVVGISATRAMVSWRNRQSPNDLRARVISISGTTATPQTIQTAVHSGTQKVGLMERIDDDNVLMFGGNNSQNSSSLNAKILTIAGNGIAVTEGASSFATSGSNQPKTYDLTPLDSTTFLSTHGRFTAGSSANQQLDLNVITTSGTTATVGTAFTLSTDTNTVSKGARLIGLTATKAIVYWHDSNDDLNKLTELDISGTTITTGTTVTQTDGFTTNLGNLVKISDTEFFIVYGNSTIGTVGQYGTLVDGTFTLFATSQIDTIQPGNVNNSHETKIFPILMDSNRIMLHLDSDVMKAKVLKVL